MKRIATTLYGFCQMVAEMWFGGNESFPDKYQKDFILSDATGTKYIVRVTIELAPDNIDEPPKFGLGGETYAGMTGYKEGVKE